MPAPARIACGVLACVVALRALFASVLGKPPKGDGDDRDDRVAGDHAEAVRLLVEGELRLLALFDARQSSADARMAAASTGALALPAATLALAAPLQADKTLFNAAYGLVVLLVIVVLGMRYGSGFRRRRAEKEKRKESGGRPRKKLSTESLDAALARDDWWRCEATDSPLAVQERALALWRTRAKHSRDVAQIKDIAAAIAGAAFMVALLVSVFLVIRAEFNPGDPAIGS